MKKVFLYLERGLAIGFLVTTVCLLLNEGAAQEKILMETSICILQNMDEA